MRPLLELHACGFQLRHLAERLLSLSGCAEGNEDCPTGRHLTSVPHPFAFFLAKGWDASDPNRSI
jgi:hypothetical protein